MATLGELEVSGALVRHEADLDWKELPSRYVYLSPEAYRWCANELAVAELDRSRDLTPAEQVEQRLYEFVVGQPLVYSLGYRKLDPLLKHVWELKTEDVRLIGWFPRKGTFVIGCGCMKRDVPKFRCYTPYINEVVQFRDDLDLDLPKAVEGINRDAVL